MRPASGASQPRPKTCAVRYNSPLDGAEKTIVIDHSPRLPELCQERELKRQRCSRGGQWYHSSRPLEACLAGPHRTEPQCRGQDPTACSEAASREQPSDRSPHVFGAERGRIDIQSSLLS